jgi:hypothetical protein
VKLLDRAASQKEEIRPDVAWGSMIDVQEVQFSSGVGVPVVGKIDKYFRIIGSRGEDRLRRREPKHQRLEAAGEGLSE